MDRKIEKKRFTPKKIAMYSSIALFVFFVLYVFVFSDQSRKLNQEKDKLTIFTVMQGKFQDYTPVSGIVEPIQTFYLDLTEGGKVVEKFVQDGSFLKAGDAIIKLDNPSLALQVMSTQSSFLQAENLLRQNRLSLETNRIARENSLLNLNKELMNQKRNYIQTEALYNKGLESKNNFDVAKEQYEYLVKSRELTLAALRNDSLTSEQLLAQAQANLEKNQEYLRLVQNQLSNLTVRAPISGQLSAFKAEIGQNIGPGYRIGQIDNTDNYKIRAEVDEHYIARVRVGLNGVFEFDGKEYKLEIKAVYPQVVNNKFYVDMYFVGDAPKSIRRGQSVYIKLDLGGESEAILVEAGGFFQSTGGQYIFVLDPSGNFAVRRSIKINRQNPQYYEIVEGLKPGEKVITSSYENFGDAEKIILN